MDPCTCKVYHEDGFDSRQYLDNYFADNPKMVFAEDTLLFPIEKLTKFFTAGHIKGDILIDLSAGPVVHHLYAVCEFFKHLIVLKVRDRCIMELKRWVDSRTGAFDWGHAAKLHEGCLDRNSDQIQDKEGKVRSALQHVVKCDLKKENMMDPIVLPLADCIISAWLLDNISQDQDEYIGYIRKFSKLMKSGGHLIIIGCLDTTYYTVGRDRLRIFRYDEKFARKALVGEGFVIDCCEVKKRIVVSDITDYTAVIFIAAHKENDQIQDKEGKVRSALQHVVKCDLEKENMMDPIVLPLADCIISTWLLDVISKDQDEYIGHLRKFSKLLKPGGHLIIIGGLDTTYYTVGRDRLRAFTYNEEFARKALVGEGFVINCCEVKKRTAVSDLIDYEAIKFTAVYKAK